jgi:hypothetical protein
MRELDSEFGYPSQYGGVPFMNFLAGMDRGDDNSFLNKVKQDYEAKKIKSAVLDRMSNMSSGQWCRYIGHVSPWIDFCGTIISN